MLRVISCDVPGGKVKCKCTNTATLGERKNCNLPGVNVDLPTLTEKDVNDIVNWGIPNDIDFIAASFVRKPSDIDNINKVVEGADIQIISKIENQEGLANFPPGLENKNPYGTLHPCNREFLTLLTLKTSRI